MMDAALRKQYIRLVYSRAFRYLSAALVLCAVLGGLYAERRYFVFALCAAGMALLCWGWLGYLRATGTRLPGWRSDRPKHQVPYMYRRFKDHMHHRPAFLRDFRDFDDDLTAATAVDDSLFTERQASLALAMARAACGVLLLALSFIVRP